MEKNLLVFASLNIYFYARNSFHHSKHATIHNHKWLNSFFRFVFLTFLSKTFIALRGNSFKIFNGWKLQAEIDFIIFQHLSTDRKVNNPFQMTSGGR